MFMKWIPRFWSGNSIRYRQDPGGEGVGGIGSFKKCIGEWCDVTVHEYLWLSRYIIYWQVFFTLKGQCNKKGECWKWTVGPCIAILLTPDLFYQKKIVYISRDSVSLRYKYCYFSRIAGPDGRSFCLKNHPKKKQFISVFLGHGYTSLVAPVSIR